MKRFLNYINKDGLLHIFVSAVLVCVFSTFMHILLADWLTISIGFAKEVYDYKSGKGHAESRDLICDGIGILIASLFVFLLSLF